MNGKNCTSRITCLLESDDYFIRKLSPINAEFIELAGQIKTIGDITKEWKNILAENIIDGNNKFEKQFGFRETLCGHCLKQIIRGLKHVLPGVENVYADIDMNFIIIESIDNIQDC